MLWIKSISLFCLVFMLNCCSVLVEDTAKDEAKIKLEYGETILKDLEMDQQQRYQEAKQAFEEALKLDPKNKRARVLYLTVLKLTD